MGIEKRSLLEQKRPHAMPVTVLTYEHFADWIPLVPELQVEWWILSNT